MTGVTVLVLAAHADDETLGCGGTIARLVRDGYRVVVATLTDGVGSLADGDPRKDADCRWRAAQAAAKTLGCETVGWPDAEAVEDNEADMVPRLRLARAAERLVQQHRPHTVLTHHSGDLNVDHRRMHEAALVACRPTTASFVREIYAFEVPSSTEWGLSPFAPALFVDVSETLERKLEAMRCYAAEQPPWPHPRSERALRALAETRGSAAGYDAAEAFEVIRVRM